jgi:hypothetical protein
MVSGWWHHRFDAELFKKACETHSQAFLFVLLAELIYTLPGFIRTIKTADKLTKTTSPLFVPAHVFLNARKLLQLPHGLLEFVA